MEVSNLSNNYKTKVAKCGMVLVAMLSFGSAVYASSSNTANADTLFSDVSEQDVAKQEYDVKLKQAGLDRVKDQKESYSKEVEDLANEMEDVAKTDATTSEAKAKLAKEVADLQKKVNDLKAKKAKADAEAKAKAEAEQKAKEEAEQKAQQEAQAKADAEAKAKAEAEQKAQQAQQAQQASQSSTQNAVQTNTQATSTQSVATSGGTSYGSDARGAFEQICADLGVSGSEKAIWAQIITKESGWNVNATNPSSGAYGLGQSLPAGKMASAGSDWQSNAYTQLKWMYSYVHGRYGSFAGVNWASRGWY